MNSSNNDQIPKLSIIIPSFNQGNKLSVAIESIINQEFKNLELLIIDGGSTDNTVEVIKDHASEIAYWISEKDNGIYDAMNKGIAKATGEWVYFLGTDDQLIEGCLNTIFNSDVSDYNLIYGNVIFSDSQTSSGKYSFDQFLHRTINHQAVFIKLDLVKQFNGFNTKYSISADYDLMIKVYGLNKNKVLYKNVDIALYNRFGFSHQSKDYAFILDKEKNVQQYLDKDYSISSDKWAYIAIDFINDGKQKMAIKPILRTISKSNNASLLIKNLVKISKCFMVSKTNGNKS